MKQNESEVHSGTDVEAVFGKIHMCLWASQAALVIKNLLANAGDVRDAGSITGLGRCSGEGNGNPLQCPCLENPMDREA